MAPRRRPGELAELQSAQFGFQHMDLSGTLFATWGDKEWLELGIESQNRALWTVFAQLPRSLEILLEGGVAPWLPDGRSPGR